LLPTLVIGPWQVSTYQVTAGTALVLGGMWTFHRLIKQNLPPRLVLRGVVFMGVGGILGAYGMRNLINTSRAVRGGPLFRPEGLSITWGLASAAAAAVVYCRWKRLSLGKVLDAAALPLALALAIGRVGCFATGCCYGRPTESWLGLYLPDSRGMWTVRYPTQLMALGANLLIFAALIALERRWAQEPTGTRGLPFDGLTALLFFGLYSIKRFVLAYARQAGAFPMVGPFSWMHVSALIGLGLVVGAILRRIR